MSRTVFAPFTWGFDMTQIVPDFQPFTVGKLNFMAVNIQHQFVSVTEKINGTWTNPVAISSPEMTALVRHTSMVRQALGQAMQNALEHLSRMEQGGAPLDPISIQADQALLQLGHDLLQYTTGEAGII